MGECGFVALGKLSQTCKTLDKQVKRASIWRMELIQNNLIPLPHHEKEQVINFYTKFTPLIHSEILGNSAPGDIFQAKQCLAEQVVFISSVLLQKIKDIYRKQRKLEKIEERVLCLIVREGYQIPTTLCFDNSNNYSNLKNLMTIAIEKDFSYETVHALVQKEHVINKLTIEKAIELSDEKIIRLLIDHCNCNDVEKEDLKSLIVLANQNRCSYSILDKLNRFFLERM